jgi:hypothetical protein
MDPVQKTIGDECGDLPVYLLALKGTYILLQITMFVILVVILDFSKQKEKH